MKPSPVPIALSMLLIAPTVRADAFVWAKQLTSTINCSGVPEGVALDSAGNVYVAGHFCGTADFDPGPGTQVRAAASRDAYVLKLDSAGRFLWVAQLGTGPMATQAFDLVVDPAGNVAVTGTFLGTVDFDPGAATFNLTSAGNLDVFVVKLDSSGALLWARQVGSTGLDSAEGIARDPAGNVYAVGLFNGTDSFISRLSPSPMGGSVSGLMVRKSGATDIRLDWNPACTPSMPAYGVYEGVLGDFDSHFARACFFGLVTNITFTPGTGSSYYLVVPNDDFDEGSYGRNSAGVERPIGVGQCMSQVTLLGCP